MKQTIIFTTEKTNISFRIGGNVAGIILALGGMYAGYRGVHTENIAIIPVAVALFLIGALVLWRVNFLASTHVTVYEDHIEGVGIHGFRKDIFYKDISELIRITGAGNRMYLYTKDMRYVVIAGRKLIATSTQPEKRTPVK